MGPRILSLFTLCALSTVLIAATTARAWCSTGVVLADAVPLILNPDRRPGDELPSDPVAAIKAARAKIAAGDMKGAIRGLSAYLFNHPADGASKRFLGDLYFRTGDTTRAELLYDDILRDYPNDRETHNRLGTLYATENRINDAIKEFESALPGTDSVSDLVSLHARRGDLAAYKAQAERTAAEYPTNADVQAELGQVYTALHQPYQAVVYFRRALDSDPSSLTAINGLGLAFLDMHDYPSAIQQFQRCLRLEPDSFQCLDNLGAAQLENGNDTVAKATLEHAHAVAPERPEPLVNFGYMADSTGDWKKAVTYYAQAIAMWPYSREAYIDIGLAYEKHGLYPLAQEALIKGIAAAPEDGRLHVLLGETYEAQGERDKAIAQYKAAESSQDPDAIRLSQQYFAKIQSPGKPQ